MPIYEYRCPLEHTTTEMRSIAGRYDAVTCECGQPALLSISRAHVAPDGVYSYMPNVGDPDRFERQRQAIKDGVKVIKREHPRGYEPRE